MPLDALADPGTGRPGLAFAAQARDLVPQVRPDVGIAERGPAGAWGVATTARAFDAERVAAEIGAEPVEADARQRRRRPAFAPATELRERDLEVSHVRGRLLVRVARRLSRVEPVQPASNGGEVLAPAGGGERLECTVEPIVGEVAERAAQMPCTGGVVELSHVGLEQQRRADARQTLEV